MQHTAPSHISTFFPYLQKQVRLYGRAITYYTVILLIGTILGGASVKLYYENRNASHVYKELRSSQFNTKLTNPLLECDSGFENLTNTLTPFEHVVSEHIEKQIRENQADTVSYYFRELDNGVWFAFNEEEQYIPASLFKVPVLMTVLHAASNDPSILQQKLLYSATKEETQAQNFRPENYLENNKLYTVEELLQQMITESDNEAAFALESIVDISIYNRLLALSQIKVLDDPTVSHVNVIQYSGFFRILYNASFLGIEQSENALEMLTHSSFDKGLEAGLPKDTVIAHKFGERRTPDNKLQLHDCGIVYVPQRNYLVCVMTKGDDFQKLSNVISKLSEITYTNTIK